MPRLIPLGKRSYTLVDDEDYVWAAQYRWTYYNAYAGRLFNIDGKRTHIFLHRLIVNPLPGFVVDHINRNPRDNRRCNLRPLSSSENVLNSTRGSRMNLCVSLLKPGECYSIYNYDGSEIPFWQKERGLQVSTKEMDYRVERYYVEQMLAFVPPEHHPPALAI